MDINGLKCRGGKGMHGKVLGEGKILAEITLCIFAEICMPVRGFFRTWDMGGAESPKPYGLWWVPHGMGGGQGRPP